MPRRDLLWWVRRRGRTGWAFSSASAPPKFSSGLTYIGTVHPLYTRIVKTHAWRMRRRMQPWDEHSPLGSLSQTLTFSKGLVVALLLDDVEYDEASFGL